MDCRYSHRDIVDKYGRHYIICNQTNMLCINSRICPTVRDIVNTDNYMSCKTYKQQEEYRRSKGMKNKILFEKRGFLHIENEEIGQIVMIANPYVGEIPEYVDLILIDGTYYIKGYEPKKVYTKKEIPQNEKRS